MKKIFLSLTAVVALMACSKEQEVIKYDLYDGEVSTIFAKFNPVTKTTIELAGDQAAYAWEESEKISVYNGSSALEYTVVDRKAGSFQYAGDPGGDLAYAVSPADAISSPSAGSYELTIKANYTDYKSNVSNAIMVAGAPSDVIDDKPVFAFQHAAALMRFTYENVPVGTTGLKFSTDKKINGTFTVSGSTPELTLANASGTTETKLTLASAVSSANTSIIFYVPIPTGNYSTFTVTLFNGEGDIASTTKTMNAAFTATKGHVINTPVITLNYENEATYNRINSTAAITDGDYLIVCEASNVALDGSLDPIDVSSNNISVSPSGGVITASTLIDASAVTITNVSGGYTILTKSGLYLGHTGSKNTLDTSTEASAYLNTISFSGNTATIAIGTYHIRYNSDSGQERFRYYTTAANVQLYKRSTGSSIPQLSVPQGLTVDAASKTISWHTVKNAVSYVLVVGGDDYSSEISISGNTASATIDIADEYYDVSVVAVSSNPASIRNSAAATLSNAKFGNPTLTAPSSFVTGTVTDNSIQVSWTGDPRATKYHCSISPAHAIDQEPTSSSVTFSGLTKGEDYVITVYAVDETGAYANSTTASTTSIKAQTSATWHSESLEDLDLGSSYIANSSVDGDLGTWEYDGCSGFDAAQFSTERCFSMGKNADAEGTKPTVTSPTFANGIKGIKVKWYSNNNGYNATLEVYENGVSVKSQTLTATAKSTLYSAEISVSTSKSTYFVITSNNGANRRFSVGDFEVKY